MVHFWQFFGRVGWGHCLVLETNASDPRDAPPGFGRHWSAVHGFQNPGWTACRHLYSISWICCTFVLHHAVVQSLGCFTKKKNVCYCRQFRWIRCERWAKFHFVRFRRFRTYTFNILKRACAKIQCIKKNEGILAPKPLGRGIWCDFYALFPGDLVGFCLIVKTNPRGCPRGQPPGKPMISA